MHFYRKFSFFEKRKIRGLFSSKNERKTKKVYFVNWAISKECYHCHFGYFFGVQSEILRIWYHPKWNHSLMIFSGWALTEFLWMQSNNFRNFHSVLQSMECIKKCVTLFLCIADILSRKIVPFQTPNTQYQLLWVAN